MEKTRGEETRGYRRGEEERHNSTRQGKQKLRGGNETRGGEERRGGIKGTEGEDENRT